MIYLASPYSHPDASVREDRFRAARDLTALLIQAGELVYSPILHSHPLADRGLPGDWPFWARHNRFMIRACTALWVMTLDGWQASVGVKAEIAAAKEQGLPIRYGIDLSKDGAS